jgi:hypothetical protein
LRVTQQPKGQLQSEHERNKKETNTKSRSQSHVTTDGQSASLPRCQAPSGAQDQILVTIRELWVCSCGARSLTRGRVCPLRAAAHQLRQDKHPDMRRKRQKLTPASRLRPVWGCFHNLIRFNCAPSFASCRRYRVLTVTCLDACRCAAYLKLLLVLASAVILGPESSGLMTILSRVLVTIDEVRVGNWIY